MCVCVCVCVCGGCERNTEKMTNYHAWSHSLDKVGNGVGGLVQHCLYVTELKEYHGLHGDQCIILGTSLKVKKKQTARRPSRLCNTVMRLETKMMNIKTMKLTSSTL